MSGFSSNPYPGGSFSKRPYIPPKAVSCPGYPYCSVCPSRKERKEHKKEHNSSPNKMSSRKHPMNQCCSPQDENPSAANPDSPNKPACRGRPHCMLCMDRPRNPSFLDCLIQGIDYLDRSLNKDADISKLDANNSKSEANISKPEASDSKSKEKSEPISNKSSLNEVVQEGTTSKVNSANSSSENQKTSSTLKPTDSQSSSKTLANPLPSKSETSNAQEDPWMGASIQISRIPKLWEKIQEGLAAKPDPSAALWW